MHRKSKVCLSPEPSRSRLCSRRHGSVCGHRARASVCRAEGPKDLLCALPAMPETVVYATSGFNTPGAVGKAVAYSLRSQLHGATLYRIS